MILHTVNKSPFSNHCLSDCLDVCAPEDSVLLIEDGVYAVMSAVMSAAMKTATATSSATTFYALRADLEARGLLQKVSERITVIDDSGFVELATRHDQVVAWY